jgi:hypothetical protein
MSNAPVWSILIPTIGPRLSSYSVPLVEDLEKQIGDKPIELLMLYDNSKRTSGGKRNSLLHIARGSYVSFVDDDDIVSADYIDSIYRCLGENSGVDLITFNTISRPMNSDSHICKHRLDVDAPGYFEDGVWYGCPSHLMVWKYDIARSVAFPSVNFGEDYEWMTKAVKKVKTCVDINRLLYSYELGRSSVPKEVHEKLGDPFAS